VTDLQRRTEHVELSRWPLCDTRDIVAQWKSDYSIYIIYYSRHLADYSCRQSYDTGDICFYGYKRDTLGDKMDHLFLDTETGLQAYERSSS